MSDNVDLNRQPPPAAPPPANQTGDNGTGKTYTQDEVDSLFRGQGKELEKLRAQVAEREAAERERQEAAEAAERERLTKQGEFKTLAEQAEERARKAEEQLTEFQQRETARLEAVTKANTARIKALPEHLQALVPAGLNADATADHLSKLEGIAGVQPQVSVHGGPPRGGQPLTTDAVQEQQRQRGRNFVLGGGK